MNSWGTVQITGISNLAYPHIEQIQPLNQQTFQQALSDIKEHWWVVTHLHNDHLEEHLITVIQNQTLMAVSDGSFKDKIGTSAFILHSGDITQSMWGVNAIPGPTHIQPAFHSELAGILGSLILVQTLCTTGNIETGEVTIALNSQQAITNSSQS